MYALFAFRLSVLAHQLFFVCPIHEYVFVMLFDNE